MEASSRQVLPMARAFAQMGYEITTVCQHKSDLGNMTKFKNHCYVVADIDTDYSKAEAFYKKIIEKNGYDYVIPLSDFSAEIAAKNKKEWEEKYSCSIAVNDLDVFNLAYDKLNTMRVCMENDIPCPQTLLINDFSELDIGTLKFPLVVKPRSACGSIGFHKVSDAEKLKLFLKDNSHGPLLVQEFIPQSGRQFNAHFFLDNNHDVKTAICTQKCRWFPVDGGASTLCRTIKNEYIIGICTKLLKKIGWTGYCDIDLMEDPRDGSIRIIEINARISANVKICFSVGANIAEQIVELVDGKKVSSFMKYKIDKRLRCIHTDLLWFLKSENRFKTEPSWISFRNTTDQIFSIDDLMPFISFSISALLKYKKEMKKRER
jgi:predicted ATP-grasp superfamily ATP-dependent carboligase